MLTRMGGGLGGMGRLGRVSVDAGPFSPASSGLLVWADPTDLSTMRQGTTAGSAAAAVDSPVGYIANKGSLGGAFVFATGTAVLRLVDGFYKLEMAGDGAALAGVDLSASSALGLLLSCKPSGVGTMILLELSNDVNSSADAFSIYMDAAKINVITQAGGSYDSVASDATHNGTTALMSFQSMDITQAAAASKFPLRVNGAAAAVTVTNEALGARSAFGNYPLNLGARGGSTLTATMDFFGLMLRGTPFSADELANLEAWLDERTPA